jgi:CspA family cold shock protein
MSEPINDINVQVTSDGGDVVDANKPLIVVNERPDDFMVGKVTGQCKWFNDKLGYGFITVQDGNDKGKDIFVHHSGVKPLNSNYRTLRKGEYVNFDIVDGDNGPQGVNVGGIGGGSLMCDVIMSSRQEYMGDPMIINDMSYQQQPQQPMYVYGYENITPSNGNVVRGPGGRGGHGRNNNGM